MRQPVLANCNRQKHLLLRAIEVARRTLGHPPKKMRQPGIGPGSQALSAGKLSPL